MDNNEMPRKNDHETSFYIYFNDLKEEVQEELLKFMNVKSSEELNWDCFPITTLCNEDFINEDNQ